MSSDIAPSPSKSVPVSTPSTGTANINMSREERLLSAGLGGALIGLGTSRGWVGGGLLGAAGSYLVFRGVAGHCPLSEAVGIDHSEADANDWAVEVHRSVSVVRSRDEVYDMWKDFERFPEFMHHIESVTDLGNGRSRWRAAPGGKLGPIEWEAEIVEDRKGESIAWRSIDDAVVDNAGVIHFEEAPGDHGTQVHVRIAYRPPAGRAGGVVASWLKPVLGQMVNEDIQRFKQLAEAGEIPTTERHQGGHAASRVMER
ncbi:SRPBCC family protein [soil metagenome]